MIVRINEMPKDVDLQILHMRGDLDTRNNLQPYPLGFRHGHRKTLQCVMIGDGQNRDIAVLGEAYQLLRREDAVRSSRMGVQIDKVHGVNREWLASSHHSRGTGHRSLAPPAVEADARGGYRH